MTTEELLTIRVPWGTWFAVTNLNPWSTVLLEKLTSSQLVNNHHHPPPPTFYGTLRLIIAYKRAGHLSLSWARSIQSMSHPTSWRSILKLMSYLGLGVPNGLYLSGFPTKTLNEHLLQHVLHTPPIPFFFIWSPEYYVVRVQIGIVIASLNKS